MKQWATRSLIGLSLLTCGCQLAWDITSNLAFETCLCTDHVASSVHYYQLASEGWRQYYLAHPDKANDHNFSKGFKRGYTEYLEDGGVAGTPALPPQRYWKSCYQTPEGRAATYAWLAGYREGALMAKASGYRNFIVVPAGKCDPPHPPGPSGVGPVVPGAAAPILGDPVVPAVPGAVEPELPAPRPATTPSAPEFGSRVPTGSVRPSVSATPPIRPAPGTTGPLPPSGGTPGVVELSNP